MRRFLLLALWLAPGAALAQVRSAPAGVQLSFDFAPVVAPITAPASVSALTPAPLLAPSLIPAPALSPVAMEAPKALDQLKSESAPARKTKIDYDEFGRQVAQTPGLSTNPFQHTDAKRRILKASGYTRLYGAGGVPVSLERAADIRVGKAFESVLRAFNRR